MGATKVGAFDIDPETARKMLPAPLNPNGRPNSDVVKPWMNSLDMTPRPGGMFVIDVGTDVSEAYASFYEMPSDYVKHHVYPLRKVNKRTTQAANWWLHGEARGDLRSAIKSLKRFIITPSVSKHRLFPWATIDLIPDHQLFAFAREDDFFIGVLQSTLHVVWSLTMGTQHRSAEGRSEALSEVEGRND
jgi:type II restriction/modification system DNA methylase subunit YeeA